MAKWLAIGIGLALAALIGCGIQGPPVPPEDIGVAYTIRKEQQREAKEQAKAREKAREEQMARQAPPPAEPEAETQAAPFEGSVQPGARPSGDVQVKPR
jgi:predicted small lipoprotein YifL